MVITASPFAGAKDYAGPATTYRFGKMVLYRSSFDCSRCGRFGRGNALMMRDDGVRSAVIPLFRLPPLCRVAPMHALYQNISKSLLNLIPCAHSDNSAIQVVAQGGVLRMRPGPRIKFGPTRVGTRSMHQNVSNLIPVHAHRRGHNAALPPRVVSIAIVYPPSSSSYPKSASGYAPLVMADLSPLRRVTRETPSVFSMW